MKDATVSKVIERLVKKYPAEVERINACVKQTACLWTKKDGTAREFRDYCRDNFFTGENLHTLFSRFEEKLEYVNGHFNTLALSLRHETDEDTGPLHPADRLFSAYSPGAHFSDDMFAAKLAFMALLNFPVRTLAECLAGGGSWTRAEWAAMRLGKCFAHRVPAEVNQRLSRASSAAENYVSGYNIYMDKVTDGNGVAAFPGGPRLISHWGLRDHLKSFYSAPGSGLEKQRLISAVMERIIAQEIPLKFIDSNLCSYDPVNNTLDGNKAEREPDTRYKLFLDVFKAHLAEDEYYPLEPTHIGRKFNMVREIPEEEVEKMFTELLLAPEGKEAAGLIKARLGRGLEPFDIWYDGFKARSAVAPEELDRLAAKRYPTPAAFEKDIPNILEKLGFTRDTAAFLAEKIEVDAARGSGHAWGAQMRTEKAHLRTRVPAAGFDYQGFNVAMHELGHCVEQVFSLYRVDHTLLAGVPNTAFTEGFAFVFQDRDMEVLGFENKDPKAAHSKALDTFWATREIAGVALVDMHVWRWLYQNKDAGAEELRQAVVNIAGSIWDKYFAPVFGGGSSPILAVYSHMICYGMYLPDYPLGHIIAFQVEEYFKTHKLGTEMERMCVLGSITPRDWMRQAVGAEISPRPMLRAAGEAVKALAVSPVA